MLYTLRQGAHLQWTEQFTTRAKYIAGGLAACLIIFWGMELWYAGSHHVQTPTQPGRGNQALDVSAPKPPSATTPNSSSAASGGAGGSGSSSSGSGVTPSPFFGTASSGLSGTTYSSGLSGATGGMGGGTTGTTSGSGGTSSTGGTGGSTGGTGGSGSTTVTVPGTCLDALGKQILCTGTTTIDP